MYNDHLYPEEAKELVEQRMKEAETYSRQKQLGYSDSRTARWIFLLAVVIIVAAVALLL
jgi:hypothetical protein